MNQIRIVLALIFVLMFSTSAFAIDDGKLYNTGYYYVSGLNAWDAQIDVYLSGGIEHQCLKDDSNKKRFKMDPIRKSQFALLTAAFLNQALVNLQVKCVDGEPEILGVRVR